MIVAGADAARIGKRAVWAVVVWGHSRSTSRAPPAQRRPLEGRPSSVAQSWVSGSSRTREATGSITTIAPRSRGSRCSRSAVITSPPISEGRILWARTCTTLGPVAPLRASSRLVEIVGEDDVALGSGPIEYLGVIGPRVSDRAPMHCFDSLRFEVLSPQWREIHVDEELQAVPTGSSCSSTRQGGASPTLTPPIRRASCTAGSLGRCAPGRARS